MLAVAVICECLVLGLWMRASTRSSSCLAAGCNRSGVVLMVGGIVLAVAVISDCLVLGLWLQSLNSVVKLLGGRVHSNWCRLDGWWHRVGSCCDL